MNTEEKLKKYSERLNLYHDLTLDELIESHQHLRELNAKTEKQRTLEMAYAREIAYEDARTYCMEHEFISVEKLKTMTLKELSVLIQELGD